MKRSTVALCLVAALLALAAVGCGSKTASPTTPSGASTSSGAPSGSLTAAQFKAYVDAVKPVVVKAQMAGKVLKGTLRGLSTKPNNSWDTAAINLTQQGVFLGQAADALAAVTAPAAFTETNKQAVQALLLEEDAMRAIGSLLAARNFNALKIDPGLTGELKQAGVLQAAWRKALDEQSTALAVPLPWTWQK